MVNDVGFVISEAEDLASGQGTSVDHSRTSVQQSFIKVKKGQRILLAQTSEGGRKLPPSRALEKGVIYFFEWFCNKSKDCFKVVKVLPDPCTQYTF